MRYEIRPLGPWTGPVTTDRRNGAQFRADWNSTITLLGRETDHLGAQLVVVQVAAGEGDIRRDGMLRAGARVTFPGVRISFDSRHGPLTYATDAYAAWKANVRAIALALEALRAVDRYGVAKTGEQYRGWRAIEGASTQMSLDAAARLLAGESGNRFTVDQLLTVTEAVSTAYRVAARRLHPDVGGDRALFERVTAARDLLLNNPLNGTRA